MRGQRLWRQPQRARGSSRRPQQSRAASTRQQQARGSKGGAARRSTSAKGGMERSVPRVRRDAAPRERGVPKLSSVQVEAEQFLPNADPSGFRCSAPPRTARSAEPAAREKRHERRVSRRTRGGGSEVPVTRHWPQWLSADGVAHASRFVNFRALQPPSHSSTPEIKQTAVAQKR